MNLKCLVVPSVEAASSRLRRVYFGERGAVGENDFHERADVGWQQGAKDEQGTIHASDGMFSSHETGSGCFKNFRAPVLYQIKPSAAAVAVVSCRSHAPVRPLEPMAISRRVPAHCTSQSGNPPGTVRVMDSRPEGTSYR